MKRNQIWAITGVWLVLALVGATLLGGLQAGVQAQEPVQVTINGVDSAKFPEVVAYVTVSDETGHAIIQLPPEAFSLTEDGRPIADFGVELLENVGEPILLALVLDTSGSMKGQPLTRTKSAAIQLIGELGPADEVAVLSFDTEVKTHVELDSDKEAAVAAVESLTAAGDTALNDAIYEGIRLLADRPRGRKALIVLTDGKDTDSALSIDDAIDAANEASVPVYAVGFGSQIQPAVLERLGMLTGGHLFRSPSVDQIDESFEAVARLLRYQYVLRFLSSLAADDASHTLGVSVDVSGVQGQAEASFTAAKRPVTVAMLSPTDGQTVGGLVTLKPRFDAPGEVVEVEYLLDGSTLTKVTRGDFAFDWDTGGVPLGPHTLTVVARDIAGNQGQLDLGLVVARPIEVAFVAPPADRPISGEVTVEVAVDALAGVAQVRFAVDGKEGTSVTSPPWSFTWDSSAETPGPHSLTATAYDAASQSAAASQDVWVGLRLGLPDLAAGDLVGGLVSLAPELEAPGSVERVDYLLDGDILATQTGGDFSFDWDATGVPLGQHTLTMRVFDSAGNEGQLDLDITVVEPVVVAFVSPLEEELQDLGGDVEVAVEVTSLAEVSHVEFSVDGEPVETVRTPPYHFVWDTRSFATGAHTLTAKAYDVKGQAGQASLDTWVAFRGGSWGIWVVLVIVVLGVGIMVPMARRRRRTMKPDPAAEGRTAAGPVPAPSAPAQVAPAGGAGPVAWLVVEEGPEIGRRWPVMLGDTSLGRNRSANDIVTQSRTASRRHAVIRADANQCMYYDIEPTNPTLLNDRPVVGSHELVEGDLVRIGDVVLRFTKEEAR